MATDHFNGFWHDCDYFREITVSALREWMAELGARTSVAVSTVGNTKQHFK